MKGKMYCTRVQCTLSSVHMCNVHWRLTYCTLTNNCPNIFVQTNLTQTNLRIHLKMVHGCLFDSALKCQKGYWCLYGSCQSAYKPWRLDTMHCQPSVLCDQCQCSDKQSSACHAVSLSNTFGHQPTALKAVHRCPVQCACAMFTQYVMYGTVPCPLATPG